MEELPHESTELRKEILPFKRVDDIEYTLSWENFDQDETGNYVYIYRGLENVTADLVKDTASKSNAAGSGELKENIFQKFNTHDIKEIAKHSTEFIQGSSPILHTTMNKKIAEGARGLNGVVITYKIPKAWMLIEENQPVIGNEEEKELDFFYEIPQDFVFKIEQQGDVEILHDADIRKVEGEDIISGDDLPPPPSTMIDSMP